MDVTEAKYIAEYMLIAYIQMPIIKSDLWRSWEERPTSKRKGVGSSPTGGGGG